MGTYWDIGRFPVYDWRLVLYRYGISVSCGKGDYRSLLEHDGESVIKRYLHEFLRDVERKQA